MVFLFALLVMNFVSPVGELSYCCNRLETSDGQAGAWCQEAPQEECFVGNKCGADGNQKCSAVSTSCESTSYCKIGTCINNLKGTCASGVPEQLCLIEGGFWSPESPEDLPQCQLGCCLMGDEAAFVTQTECSQLSSDYGLEINYRADIRNELECIASATSEAKGACVFERNYGNTCLILTKSECAALGASSVSTDIFEEYYGSNDNLDGVDSSTVVFHEGLLCSATNLGANCGPRGGTTCIENDDDIYFLDTCGNLANVYDSSKLKDDNDYWTYIQEPTCGLGKNSPDCGDCGYFEGSTCKSYDRGTDNKPDYGNNICRSLDCGWYDVDSNGRRDSGEDYAHGERFCVTNNDRKNLGENLPGTRYFMMECRDGEFIEQACSEFRQEVCIEDDVEGFSNAGCVVNRWQDCTNQTSKEVCLDDASRDCAWTSGHSLSNSEGGPYATDENDIPGFCVPKYSPGFDFYANEGNGAIACSIGTASCTVTYEVGILRNREKVLEKKDLEERKGLCVSNCYCIPSYKKGDAKNKYEKEDHLFDSYAEWSQSVNNVCTALGDCGNKNNYLGIPGEEKEIFTSEFIKKPKK